MSSIDIIGSQIDVATIVSQLMLIERQPVVRLERQVSSLQSKVSAYQNFNTRLSALSDKVNQLLYGSTTAPFTKPGSFSEKLAKSIFTQGIATSSNEDVLTATAESTTAGGSYSIIINNLAKTQSTASAGFANPDTEIGIGTFTITPEGAAEPITITITEENSTLRGLKEAIGAATDKINAAIINDGSQYRLMLTSKETGTANAFTIDDSNLSGGQALGFNTTQMAADAQLTVNGINIVSGSNTVKGAIEGITLNLKKVSDAPVSLEAVVNSDSITSAINEMISAYNAANTYINSQFTYNADKNAAGVLAGDATLRSIQSKLQSQMTQGISNPLSSYRSMGQLGISFNRDGSLSLDEEKLRQALSKDFKGVASFFLGDESTGGMLTNLGETLSGLTDSLKNPIKNAMDGLNKNIQSLQNSIEMYEARLEVREDMLAAQFSAADQALRLLQVSQESLANSLASLKQSTK